MLSGIEGGREGPFTGMENLFSLEDMLKYHNENIFLKLKYNTSRLYITSQNYIRKFVKKEYGRRDLYLKELDYSFVIKFENYLRSARPKNFREGLQHNAVMKHIQRLRKMVTLAFHLEWIDRDPFVKFKLATTIGVLIAFYLEGLNSRVSLENRKEKAIINITKELTQNTIALGQDVKNDSLVT